MSDRDDTMPVSVIGLGNMGSALARGLHASGQDVVAWTRSAAKREGAAAAGVRIAPSLSDAAGAVTVFCVSNHAASMAILADEDFAQALRGKLIIQLSTVTAEESRSLSAWAAERGIDYLDGTIYCYPASILECDGTIFYSGPRALFDANKSVLEGMGGKPRFLTETIGAAPTYDKALYAFHYGSMISFLHGAAISHAAGIPLSDYVEQALLSASSTTTKERMANMIEARRYETEAASISVELGAYEYVVKLSDDLGVESELPRVMAGIMRRACNLGYAEQDLAATFEALLDPARTAKVKE